jgi:NADPH:quinone reductase-like Zn-dependent oxidoreductase
LQRLTARRATVTATASSQDQLDLARRAGTRGCRDRLRRRVALGQNIAALAPDGRMVILSFLSGRELEKVHLGPLLLKRLRLWGTTLRARSVPYQADLVERFRRDAVGKLTGADGHGELKTYVHKVFPWTEIRAAHVEIEGNKNSGKIIVEVNEESSPLA